MTIRKSILIFVIIAACLTAYFNSLFGEFVWDDNIFIIENPYMKSFMHLSKFFVQDFWKTGAYVSQEGSSYYRPMLAVSCTLDYVIWRLNPLGYHITNIVLHVLASILLFLFLELLLKNRLIAFVSSLLFSVHPIHTEVVSFISGRVDSIPFIFFFLSLIFFLKYAYRNKLIFYALSLFCFLISLLSKEMAVALPLIVLIIDYLFLSQQRVKPVARRMHIGFLAVLALYLLMRSYFVGWMFFAAKPTKLLNFDSGVHIFWRLFTFLKIIAIYLRLLFLPYGLNAYYYFPPANSLFEPLTLMGLILLVFFVFIAVKNTKRNPIISFSIFWFFITILPVSNIFPQGNIFAERYLYLPSVSFCVIVGFLFYLLLDKSRNNPGVQKIFYILFFIVIFVLGKVSYERNKVWKNDLSLWSDIVKKTPSSSFAHSTLAATYAKLDLLDKAEEEARLATAIDPNFHYAVYILGHTYIKKGMLGKAAIEFEKLTQLIDSNAFAYDYLAAIYGMLGAHEKAMQAAIQALEKNPSLDNARYNLAISYQKIGLSDEAINTYEDYLRNNPDNYKVHLEVGRLYYDKGDKEKAKQHWLKALEISGDYQPALEALELLEE